MNSAIENTYYLWGVLLIVPFWLWIFWKQKNNRADILKAGFSYGIAAIIIGILFSHDYWHANYIFGKKIPVEEFLYGFFFGGIVYELHEFTFNQIGFSSKKTIKIDLTFEFSLIACMSFFFFYSILYLNSTNAMSYTLLVVGFYRVIIRPNLMTPAITSAILSTLFTLIWQKLILLIYPNIFIDNWNLKILSNFFLFQIPIEEMFFAFSMGFGGSSLGIFQISILDIFFNNKN